MWFAIVPTVVLAAIAQFVMLNLLSHLIPDGHSEIRKYIAFIPLIGAVLGTVTCVTKIVAVAGLLWLAVTLMDGSLSFQGAILIAGFAQLTAMLHLLSQLYILWIRQLPIGQFRNADIGLNLFVPPDNHFSTLLALVNPFSFWYLVIVFYGVLSLGKLGPGRSAAVTMIYTIAVVFVVLAKMLFLPTRG